MIAKFDDSVVSSYATKTLAPSPSFRFVVQTVVPSWVLVALLAGLDGGGILTLLGDGLVGTDGLFPAADFGSWQWWSFQTLANADGSLTPDVTHTLQADATFDSGTTWLIVWSVDGVPLFGGVADAIDLGIDATGGMGFAVGGYNGQHVPNEDYFVRSVSVYDSGLALVFFDDFSSGDFSLWDAVVGSASVVSAIPPPPPLPPRPATPSRFFEGYPWRFVFTDLSTATTTWAEGLLTNRRIAFVLDDASVIEADVWPDDFRVNGIWTDGYPRLAQSNRLVYCLRRDNPSRAGGLPPWTCRAAGILMSPEDQGSPDVPLTHFAAFDAWRYLDARPCMDSSGDLPTAANGFQFLPPLYPSGTAIALAMLKNTITAQGTVHIDAGASYGGTGFYSGTLETTPAVDFTVQRGDSVGDCWRQLCSIGNMDIVLTPIYDPVDRPGYTHELSIYVLAGADRHDAVFGWDRLNHALTSIDRMHDGTPGAFFNKVQYFAGLGGFQLPLAVNAASVAAYGSWWAQQFFPGQTDTDPSGAATYALAKQALELAKQGKRTVTLSPTPERAPIPFDKYAIGDRVPIYASDRLRVTIDGLQRVQSIPVAIADDGIESVAGLVVSPDWRQVPPPPPGMAAIRTAASIQPQTGTPIARRTTRVTHSHAGYLGRH